MLAEFRTRRSAPRVIALGMTEEARTRRRRRRGRAYRRHSRDSCTLLRHADLIRGDKYRELAEHVAMIIRDVLAISPPDPSRRGATRASELGESRAAEGGRPLRVSSQEVTLQLALIAVLRTNPPQL